MDEYQKFIAASRYARWIPDEGRRETWEETVDRYMEYWWSKEKEDGSKLISPQLRYALQRAITGLEVMPSMRCLMTAGEALDRDNVAGFNCSYLPVDHPRAFDELLYILMCGTGVGFSVERQYLAKLPEVAESMHETDTVITVADSKIGWAKSFRELISLLYAGQVPRWDVSKVRPAGAVLKTFGGRASGPGPLEDLFRFSIEIFKEARGRRLSAIECHDLCCKIAEVVVVGGVRRSALIGLSDPSEADVRTAKYGQWWLDNNQRGMANNSACYTETPSFGFFFDEMRGLYESKSGERGVFSRQAAKAVAAKNGRRDTDWDFGTNPCSEIILRPNQFCNLTEVVVREEDTLETLKAKVTKATILGTLQATLTDFRYLRSVWSRNTKEEALLGVSLTGIMDHPVMSGRSDHSELVQWLNEMREVAVETNKKWAERFGINPSAAITCVKPSGTVSQLVNSASGIHPRHSRYYVRTVRADKKDPLAKYMVKHGFPHEQDETKDSGWVFSFPICSPEDAVTDREVGAMDLLRLWKIYQDNWCEHKPSITVKYTDDEFLDVASWMWQNFDSLSGIALLPFSDHSYRQAPYQDITEEEYEQMKASMPNFNWEDLAEFEDEDRTAGSQELACVGTSCELP